jgi:hypothetical protein
VVHEVRCPPGHATATATRTEPTPLARERNQPIQTAGDASEPGAPGGEVPTPEEASEFVLHEPRQGRAGAQALRLRQEGLEMREDDASLVTDVPRV